MASSWSNFSYCIDSNRDGNATIYDREGHVLWRSTAPFPNRHLFLFGSSPDLAFYDDAEHEALVVRSERGGPLPRYMMIAGGMVVCTIRGRSLLPNRFTLDFTDGPRWTFHMPPFAVFYRGTSETGAEVRVRLVRYDRWYVQAAADCDSLPMLAALAVIQRHRWWS